MTQGMGELMAGSMRRPLAKPQPEQRSQKIRRRSAVVLGGVPLFSSLSKRQLHRLADAADEISFRRGAKVVEEGLLGETLFVILEGQANVMRGKRKVATLLPGDFFGEVSLLDGGPRTATVVADTPLLAVRLYRKPFTKILESEPKMASQVLQTMARRLRTVERSSLKS